MSFSAKDIARLSIKSSEKTDTGVGIIASNPVVRPVRVWLIGSLGIILLVAGFLGLLPTIMVKAAPATEPPLNCQGCHSTILKTHDKLGSGNQACWVCHDQNNMKLLRLANETQLPRTDSALLCGQCHQQRYEAWKVGTHGIPEWKEGEPGFPGATRATCTTCHSPHQPQIALVNITRPHTVPTPPPPSAPVQLLIMLGVSLSLILGIGIAVSRRGEGQ
ncbi:MAG: hypothetical protein HW402_215 [Dehalococcoidales bacterium]|nr:hypothetical protein [Dehalococcoidales bacterium]